MSRSPFLQSISRHMRQKGYSLRTEKIYLHWIKRFILFHNKRHTNTMSGEEVRIFLSYLVNDLHVSTSTQKNKTTLDCSIKAKLYLFSFYRTVTKEPQTCRANILTLMSKKSA